MPSYTVICMHEKYNFTPCGCTIVTSYSDVTWVMTNLFNNFPAEETSCLGRSCNKYSHLDKNMNFSTVELDTILFRRLDASQRASLSTCHLELILLVAILLNLVKT